MIVPLHVMFSILVPNIAGYGQNAFDEIYLHRRYKPRGILAIYSIDYHYSSPMKVVNTR